MTPTTAPWLRRLRRTRSELQGESRRAHRLSQSYADEGRRDSLAAELLPLLNELAAPLLQVFHVPDRSACPSGGVDALELLSAEALGIVACLFCYSHLSFDSPSALAEVRARQFHMLRVWSADHAEALAILAAID